VARRAPGLWADRVLEDAEAFDLQFDLVAGREFAVVLDWPASRRSRR
jgi:hypothetical protein